jgi:hypothetical protein
MICGAISRCKCSSGSIEQLEFEIPGLFINTPFFGYLFPFEGRKHYHGREADRVWHSQGAAVSSPPPGDLEIAPP